MYLLRSRPPSDPGLFCFFFNDTATTEIYTLSLHDALPIYHRYGHRPAAFVVGSRAHAPKVALDDAGRKSSRPEDRKSTRLNSSHLGMSYAVFCLKKKTSHKLLGETFQDRASTSLPAGRALD